MPLPGCTALGLGVTGTLPTSIHIRHAGHDSRPHMQPHVTRPAVRIAGLLNRCVSTRHACRLTTSAALMAKHTFTESPNGRVYKTSLMTKSVSFFTASLSQLATTWQLASDLSCCQIVPHTFALQVVEVREELQRRNMDDRGTKKILVERLYQVIQQEAEQLKSAQKAAAAEPEPPPKPESRPPRTRAEMGAKLQLRSTSQPAKRAQRASRSRRAPAGTGPDALSGAQALPGASVAQLVRRALLNRIAVAAKQSAQQKQQQQQQLGSATEAQPEAHAHHQQQQLPGADLSPSEPAAASPSQHATDLNSDDHLAGATRPQQAQHPAEATPDSQAEPQQSRQQQAEAARPWQEPDGHASFVSATNIQQQSPSHAANTHVPSRSADKPAQTATSVPGDEAWQQQAATPEEARPAGSAVPTPSTSHPDPLLGTSTPPEGNLSEGLLESSPAAVKADIAVTERQGSHAAASSSARTTSSSSRSRTGSSAGSVTGPGSGTGMATNMKERHGTCVAAGVKSAVCQHAVVSVWSSIQWQRRHLTEAQAHAHSKLTHISSAPA